MFKSKEDWTQWEPFKVNRKSEELLKGILWFSRLSMAWESAFYWTSLDPKLRDSESLWVALILHCWFRVHDCSLTDPVMRKPLWTVTLRWGKPRLGSWFEGFTLAGRQDDWHTAPTVWKQRVLNAATQLAFPFSLVWNPTPWNDASHTEGSLFYFRYFI